MRKIRFMNMPVTIWLLGAGIAWITVWVFADYLPNVALIAVAVFTVIMTWFLWDTIVPTLKDNEYVWICPECDEVGVVINNHPLELNNITMDGVSTQHANASDEDEPCDADQNDIDIFRGPFKLTELPAWTQIDIWRALQHQRNKGNLGPSASDE